MVGLPELQALYQTYLEDAERVERERKPGEGLFGIGKKPSDAPCHERFAADIPRREMLPVQKQVFSKLKQSAS